MYEKRVLGEILGRKGKKVTGTVKNLHKKYIVDLESSLTFLWLSNHTIGNGRDMSHVWGRKKCMKGFCGKTEGKIPL
jgi:hypothetical protein